jgi:hypothetical protein
VIVFLNAAPVIYFVEQPPVWGRNATARIAALRAGGDRLAVSDLVRMECLVGPLKAADATRVAAFTFSPPTSACWPSPRPCATGRPASGPLTTAAGYCCLMHCRMPNPRPDVIRWRCTHGEYPRTNA